MQRKNRKIAKAYKKKQLLILSVILIFMISFVIIFGRYVTNDVKDFFVRSKEFYFYSDKLSENFSVFEIDNWTGVDDYVITVNMNSRKNNIKAATYPIEYDIQYVCTDNAICQISKTHGVISETSNSDSFNLTITPNTQLETGDRVVVEIKATSTTNYIKTIKGKFTLVVGKEDLSYEITDKAQSPYMELSITNTLSYYIVNEAFGEYTVGQKISSDVYLGLTEAQKEKCYSSIVTINFDPEEILLDITNENYQNATNINTTTIDGKTYINGFTLTIDAISSVDLRFYKVDSSKDYTYPNSTNSSVVTITSN